MKKALFVMGLGALFALGACADNNKKVTPTNSVSKDTSPSPGYSPTGASKSTVPAYDPAAASGTPSGSMGGDNTMVAGGPGMPDNSGTGIPHASPSHTSTHRTGTTTGGAKVTSASTGSSHAVAGATTASAHGKKYTVKKGDTLSAIAKKYYGKTSAIKKIVAANPGMDANKIRVGQVINLPA